MNRSWDWAMSSLPPVFGRAMLAANSVDVPLNQWIEQQVTARRDPDEIVAGIVASGRPPELASLLVRLAIDGFYLGRTPSSALAMPPTTGSPDVDWARNHVLDAGDRQVPVLFSQQEPEVRLYDNFLSDEECEFLKSVVAGRLKRSAVVGRNFSNVIKDVRTSSGAFLHVQSHPLITSVENRIAKITGYAVERGEGLQVLHYQHAEEYQPHYDFFEPQSAEEQRQMEDEAGNRIGTMILYLNDPEEGGATFFPKLNLAVHPRKGSALWFAYLDERGVGDRRTEHAGLPVLKGEKWIATKWIRQRPFRTRPPQTGGVVIDSQHAPAQAASSDFQGGPQTLQPMDNGQASNNMVSHSPGPALQNRPPASVTPIRAQPTTDASTTAHQPADGSVDPVTDSTKDGPGSA